LKYFVMNFCQAVGVLRLRTPQRSRASRCHLWSKGKAKLKIYLGRRLGRRGFVGVSVPLPLSLLRSLPFSLTLFAVGVLMWWFILSNTH
jgi:hypothetical protein